MQKCEVKDNALVYVPDDGLITGDHVVGIMFDRAKRFWLVER